MPDDREMAVARNPRRVRVLLGGAIVAESDRALTLFDPPHSPVHYIPAEDVALDLLEPSAHVGLCPVRGEARYFSVSAHGRLARDAAWTYPSAAGPAAAIAGLVAFDPRKVDAIEELSRD